MLYKVKKQKGFSLIELLVTLAISTLVVSAVLFKFESFDSVVVLKSITYEIALTVREAQVFAVSATGKSTDFDIPYGVYVNKSNPHQYIFFADDGTTDFKYDAGDTILETYSFNSKYQITQICVDTVCSADYLSLSFLRPSFDPIIDSDLGGTPNSATIRLGMVDDPASTFSVKVGLTGQVSVSTP